MWTGIANIRGNNPRILWEYNYIFVLGSATNEFKKIYKNSYKLFLLVKGNGIRATADYIISHISSDKMPKKTMFLEPRLYLRPMTADLNVAFECFKTEFDCLKELTNTASNSLIIDAGGYIGTAAISELFLQSIVVTIEPSNKNFDCLQRNIAEHKRIRNLRLVDATSPLDND